MLLLGSGVTHLENNLNQETLKVERDTFPDTEQYITLPADLPKHVYYLQSFYPHPDKKIVETLLTFDALTEHDHDFTAVFPYFPYAKQDQVFGKGEPLSVRAILHALQSRGLSAPFFVNTHFLKKPGVHTRFNLRCTNLNAAPHLLNTIIEKEHLENPVIALPGEGAAHLTEDGYDTVTVDTEREERGNEDRAYRAVDTATLTGGDVAGRSVVVLDDMIATGGTMTKTCRTIQEHGADTVIAASVHGLFLQDATTQIGNVADTVYATDTVPTPDTVETIPVTPMLHDVFTSENKG